MTVAGRARPRGPALGHAPLPLSATFVSAMMHVALAVAVLLGASAWSTSQPKTYIVNLVPAVAAVGVPQGVASPPRVEPPRVEPRTPPAPTPPAPAPELPQRETARSAPAELPQRETTRRTPPEMPARATPRESLSLPDPSLPARAPATPKPSDKELPTVASSAPPAPAPTSRPAPAPPTTNPGPRAAAPPPPPLGQPMGSPQGSGAVTVNVTDFPFAWYLGAVQRKITEHWEGRALQGHQPEVWFEIRRDGQVGGIKIAKTSGNPHYDQQALRAISEAMPFPPLPAEWPQPVLRIQLGFNFAPDRG
jgi:TonB family protein